MTNKRRPKVTRRTQQDWIIDRVVCGDLNATPIRTPLSLRPGPELVLAVAAGSQQAIAIIVAWRFHFPVVVMTREQLETRDAVVFHE